VLRISAVNLLLVGVSTVGVGFVTGLIGFLLGTTGVVLGFGVGFGLISLLGPGTFGLIAGITTGGAIAFGLILLAVLIYSVACAALRGFA